MIAKFDPIMQEYIHRIKNEEIHNHYNRHNIQNEFLRIIVVIKTLGKSNLALSGKKEKIYQESNGRFLSLIQIEA